MSSWHEEAEKAALEGWLLRQPGVAPDETVRVNFDYLASGRVEDVRFYNLGEAQIGPTLLPSKATRQAEWRVAFDTLEIQLEPVWAEAESEFIETMLGRVRGRLMVDSKALRHDPMHSPDMLDLGQDR